jgi:heterodisulfide reductase subunit B
LCHFCLTEASYKLQSEPGVKGKILNLLAEEGLELPQGLKLWHTVDFLYDRIGLEGIKQHAVHQFNGVKLAIHPGCYLIRPSKLGRIDEAENPRKLDELTEALGIETVNYPQKLECCGGLSLQSTTALAMARDKLKSAQDSGANGLVCSCPHCFEMLDSKQEDIAASTGTKLEMPVIYYTQILGFALSLREEELGLNLNRSPVDKLLSKLGSILIPRLM